MTIEKHAKEAIVASRATAKYMLEDMIRRRERYLNGLKILHQSINWDSLSKEEEELLWNLFTTRGDLL